MSTGLYIVHAADPRVKVVGVEPREPWFNTTIPVSHRWLHPPGHPDPDRFQYNELMTLCDSLKLHENQAFQIDCCSLPQEPRGPDEASWFRENLVGFVTQFKNVIVVLNTGSVDYSTRAWCMLELMLASMNQTPDRNILNHNQLDEPLRNATRLAESYVEHSDWNQQQMLEYFGSGVTWTTVNKWTRDLGNVGMYNTSIDKRNTIRRKFEFELKVTDPKDTPEILRLLEKLAFKTPI
jgi:hypothetical protein